MDANRVLDKKWNWGLSMIVLQRCSFYFDTKRDLHHIHKVSTILPGLPMDLWEEETLQEIINKIGIFVGL
jgi:hypothetical protein